MSEEACRVMLIGMTVLGFALTSGGLLAAVISAFREVEASRLRIWKSMRLAAEERCAIAAEQKRNPHSTLTDTTHTFMRRYAADKLIRPNYNNVIYIPALEARRLVKLTLQGAVVNLVVAGIGLAVSTAASIIALIVL